jgi:hypothetical protein
MTIEIRGEDTLHGKRAKLTRGGKEVTGVIIAQDMKNQSGDFMFRWADENGKTCLSPIDKDELKIVHAQLYPTAQNPPDTKED